MFVQAEEFFASHILGDTASAINYYNSDVVDASPDYQFTGSGFTFDETGFPYAAHTFMSNECLAGDCAFYAAEIGAFTGVPIQQNALNVAGEHPLNPNFDPATVLSQTSKNIFASHSDSLEQHYYSTPQSSTKFAVDLHARATISQVILLFPYYSENANYGYENVAVFLVDADTSTECQYYYTDDATPGYSLLALDLFNTECTGEAESVIVNAYGNSSD